MTLRHLCSFGYHQCEDSEEEGGVLYRLCCIC